MTELEKCTIVVPLRDLSAIAGKSGGGALGHVDGCNSALIEGWACDAGTEAETVVALQLESDFGPTSRRYYLADGPRETSVARRCRTTSSSHGFFIRIPRQPPGQYRARIFAFDGEGQNPRELKNCTITYDWSSPGRNTVQSR